MRKRDELSSKSSCMATAHPREMTFVLIGRDVAAPFAIRAWCDERIRLGKNTEGDAQIVEARACADTMEREGRQWVGTASCSKRSAVRDHHEPAGVKVPRALLHQECNQKLGYLESPIRRQQADTYFRKYGSAALGIISCTK